MRTKPCFVRDRCEDNSRGLRGRSAEKQLECGSRHRRRGRAPSWLPAHGRRGTDLGGSGDREGRRTSALTKRPSKFFEDRVKDRPAFTSFPAGVLIQGALPIMHQNECVGAIGVSGVQSHEDEQIAQAGLNALG